MDTTYTTTPWDNIYKHIVIASLIQTCHTLTNVNVQVYKIIECELFYPCETYYTSSKDNHWTTHE